MKLLVVRFADRSPMEHAWTRRENWTSLASVRVGHYFPVHPPPADSRAPHLGREQQPCATMGAVAATSAHQNVAQMPVPGVDALLPTGADLTNALDG